MFIRENKNRSGSVSVQIVSKTTGVYKVIKTIGCGTQRHEIECLKMLARQEIERLHRGHNKYLELDGEINIKIDYQKFEQDAQWDGLKGYATNTKLSNNDVLENYRNLFHIERAFRMSKTDLRIRPIYHRLRHRIEAHICIAFTAYVVYKELERVLKQENASISLKTASEITHNMYQITYQLPDSKYIKSALLKMDEQQSELYQIILKYF
jgi:transposase